MRQVLKTLWEVVPPIVAGFLLTTGGVSWVEADPDNCWHHGHTVYAHTTHKAKGKCAYNCSVRGHSGYRVTLKNPGTWYCECS